MQREEYGTGAFRPLCHLPDHLEPPGSTEVTSLGSAVSFTSLALAARKRVILRLLLCVCVCVCVCVSCSVMSDSLQLHLAHQVPCPWNFPGKNTGVGCHSLLQGNLPNPRIKPMSHVSCIGSGFSPTAPPRKPFFKPIKQMDLTYLIIISGARKIVIHCHVEKSRKYNSSM